MRSIWINLILALVAASAALAVEETVTYPELKGFKSITYKSEFFGYQSGVNRDFTNYGRGFAEPVEHEPGWNGFKAEIADFDGDGLPDAWDYEPKTGALSIRYGTKGGGFGTAVRGELPAGITGGALVAADFNGDLYSDIALYRSTACPDGFAFFFGRGNGRFGPTKAEEKTNAATHLSATFPWAVPNGEQAIPLAGRLDDDGTADIGLLFLETRRIVTRVQSYHPAYDYSVHLVKDGSQYKMWHGGRWRTLGKDGEVLPAADGDHVMYAWSPDGRRWFRKIDDAVFPKGDELGIHDWWTNNYLEPEVLKVNGKYYMYWQAEVDGGTKLDYGGTAARQCDRIGLSTSKDGVNWERKTDRGVVINVPNPTNTNLDHQEAIYVPDDKDGKPWWLYTFHFVDGAPAGHVRMRSKDPTTFDWNLREPVSGMSQIGNQIGYADEAPGGRMFFRVTFTGTPGGRTVPTFQLSRDGLTWITASSDGQGRPHLASSTDEKNNKNVCFLGMSTVDGTGKMEHLGGGRFRCLYGATTSNGPGQPEIWFSEIGVGEAYITFDKGGR